MSEPRTPSDKWEILSEKGTISAVETLGSQLSLENLRKILPLKAGALVLSAVLAASALTMSPSDIPTPASQAELSPATSHLVVEDPHQQQAPAEQSALRITNAILKGAAERLDLDVEVFSANMKTFANTTAKVESEGKGWTNAKNAVSSAAGAFQFIVTSVHPALVRLETQLSRENVPMPEWAIDLKATYSDADNIFREEHQEIITGLSYEQQEILFLADITEKTVIVDGVEKPGLGDALLKLHGNETAMKALYAFGHHTNGVKHQATADRASKYFTDHLTESARLQNDVELEEVNRNFGVELNKSYQELTKDSTQTTNLNNDVAVEKLNGVLGDKVNQSTQQRASFKI